MWKIERIVKKGSYDYAVVPGHPNATKNGYVLMHRVVVENHLGRLLKQGEEVHHLDKNGHNNDISNLRLVTSDEHRKIHAKERTRKHALCICPNCLCEFDIAENELFIHKNCKNNFCSKRCRSKFYRNRQLGKLTRDQIDAAANNIVSIYKKEKD